MYKSPQNIQKTGGFPQQKKSKPWVALPPGALEPTGGACAAASELLPPDLADWC